MGLRLPRQLLPIDRAVPQSRGSATRTGRLPCCLVAHGPGSSVKIRARPDARGLRGLAKAVGTSPYVPPGNLPGAPLFPTLASTLADMRFCGPDSGRLLRAAGRRPRKQITRALTWFDNARKSCASRVRLGQTVQKSRLLYRAPKVVKGRPTRLCSSTAWAPATMALTSSVGRLSCAL